MRELAWQARGRDQAFPPKAPAQLLAEWLAAALTERSVAWLSLDESDSQPASYWTYLITALQAVVPGVGASALPLLQSAQAPIETVLTTVLNELGSVPTTSTWCSTTTTWSTAPTSRPACRS